MFEEFSKESPLSFEDVHKAQYSSESSKPIEDPRLVAGLLFVRWNDRTKRYIENHRNTQPEIIIETIFDFLASSFSRCLTTTGVVELLLQEGILCGKLCFQYTDLRELNLSPLGRKLVVTQWFCDDINLTDIFVAGASMEQTGKIHWPV